MGKHENRIVLFAVSVGLALAGSVCADDNVRAVQEKLRDGGFYSGEIDGAYSSQLAAALTRFQVRKGLPVTGQLDVETGNALDAKPAVTKDTAAPEQSSETWRRLRKREQQTTSTVARERSSPHTDRSVPEVGPAQSGPVATSVTAEPAAQSAGSPVPAVPISGVKPAPAQPATARTSADTTEPASAPPATTSADEFSTERLRDYIGAFVLAGLDPHVGSEADFFADRVKYYDQGVIDREQIRNDLQDYAAHWPQRRFWFVGNIKIEPQHRKRVRVTFPLRYELRNGATSSSGTINKTLVLEPAGDDLQIVEVNETQAE
jgi:peptidoglycan hydrolase-like protein with peptidoglycan-binding domain